MLGRRSIEVLQKIEQQNKTLKIESDSAMPDNTDTQNNDLQNNDNSND